MDAYGATEGAGGGEGGNHSTAEDSSGPAERVPPWEFHGTARFELLRQVARGGMGVVYEVMDRDRQAKVALKTMLDPAPDALIRLKAEFRALADVAHPNLISLHELSSDAGRWFFTMELVDGVDFLRYVRGGGSGPIDHARLRDALRQLVRGLGALHASGRVHRDIKPANVMVSGEGRVVVLDFGLVTGVGWRVDEVAGTPAYMAPEQFRAEHVTAASDFYSVGVMLHQALARQVPKEFSGSGDTPIAHQAVPSVGSAASPRAPLDDDVPEDLRTLCLALLQDRPAMRPTGKVILERLAGGAPVRKQRPRFERPVVKPPSEEAALFGRTSHLAALRAALVAVRDGQGITVFLHGPSGAGKTALADAFLSEAVIGGAAVLSGRCYERESVPFKAVDSLIDALGRHLAKLPLEAIDALLSPDASAIGQVFPVLQPVVARCAPIAGPLEPHELRRRALAALEELWRRLAASTPLVLFIDDLQWGDPDSAPLVETLQRQKLLLIASYRSEHAKGSALLAHLQAHRGPHVRDLPVEMLSPADAQTMAMMLLGAGADTEYARAIAHDSGGHPYFIFELARSTRRSVRTAGAPLTLDSMIRDRVSMQPNAAQRLLQTIAVAGRPTTKAVVVDATSEIDRAELQRSLHDLNVARLIRTSGLDEDDVIEPYHDRIREAVVTSLAPAELTAHHRRLALAIERSADPDSEAMAIHFLAAGDRDAGARHAALAADQAARSLSFEHAAQLYRLALAARAADAKDAADLWSGDIELRLAESLVNAGRGGEAAPVYLAAAERATGLGALDLRRHAAEQYLRSGHFDDGLATIGVALAAVGMKIPGSPARGIASLLARRIQLRMRGLALRDRASSPVTPEQRFAADVCLSAAFGICVVDPARGAGFAARSALLALELGDPARAVKALAVEGCFTSTGGAGQIARTAAIAKRVDELAAQAGDPALLAYSHGLRGFAAYQQGEFMLARDESLRAEAVFRAHGTGVAWDIGSVQLTLLASLVLLGEFRALAELGPERAANAEGRGDLYASTNLRALFLPYMALAADRPKAAREDAHEAAQQWSRTGFYHQHFMALVSAVHADLYTGDAVEAHRRIVEAAPALERALLLHVQAIRIHWLVLRATSAIAAAGGGAPDAKRLLRAAAADARKLARQRLPWADAISTLCRASLAHARGRPDDARALLENAIECFIKLDMALHVAVARRRLGELIGGDSGTELIAAADVWFASQGFASPARTTALWAPGFAAT